jgi:hypothetical protein
MASRDAAADGGGYGAGQRLAVPWDELGGFGPVVAMLVLTCTGFRWFIA